MKLRVIQVFSIFIVSFNILFAQAVSINGTGNLPDAAAILDIDSKSKGLLIPRVFTNERINFANTAKGLIVYDYDTESFWFHDGLIWKEIAKVDIVDRVEDLDGDTYILVDKDSNDDDIIRFYNEGVEYVNINNGRMDILNTGKSVFIGEGAGASDDLTNNRNTFIGYHAGQTTDVGIENVAIGNDALTNNEGGNHNIGIGPFTLNNNDFGNNNIAIGKFSQETNTSGNGNISLGNEGLYNNNSGSNNIAIGNSTLYNNDKSNLVAIGDSALFNNGIGAVSIQGTGNTVVGDKGMFSNTIGAFNTSIGQHALKGNVNGNNNTAVGVNSLLVSQSGNFNTAFGNHSLISNISGHRNVSLGTESMFDNMTGDDNVAIGFGAGAGNIAGNGNIFLGYEAGSNFTGSNELFIDNTDTSTPLIGGSFVTNQVEINGTIKITGGVPGDGKVLTSNATGEAAWERPTKSITLGPHHFSAPFNNDYRSYQTWLTGGESSAYELVAPITLPGGSTIDEVVIYYVDDDSNNMLFKLVESELNTITVSDTIMTPLFTSSTNDDLVRVHHFYGPVLVNGDSSYTITIRCQDSSGVGALWPVPRDLKISGIKIIYQE